MARAGGGRDDIPHDLLAVTVMTMSGGSSQPPLKAGGSHGQHRELPFSPGKGEPAQRSQAAGKEQGCRHQADGGGAAPSQGQGCGWRMGETVPQTVLGPEIMTRRTTPAILPVGKVLLGLESASPFIIHSFLSPARVLSLAWIGKP